MTEAEALLRFERENASLRGFEAQSRSVQADVRSWSRWANPSAVYAREDAAGTRDEFLLLQQTVPLSGRLGLMGKAGRAAVASIEAESAYAGVRLRSDFRTVFFVLLAAQRRLALLESGAQPLREISRVLGEREKEGESSTFDRLRADRELVEVETALERARVLRIEAQSRLSSFLAEDADPLGVGATGSFAGSAEIPSLEDLTARALSVRGDYLAERKRIERFEYERNAAGRMVIPEPIVSGGLKRTAFPGLTETGFTVSVAVPLPLFDGGGSQRARARADRERSEAAAAALRRSVETEVRAAYEALLSYRRLARNYAESLGDKGERLSGISRLSYEEGEQGILELLDSHRVALGARLQALELALSAKLAEFELNRAVGEEVIR